MREGGAGEGGEESEGLGEIGRTKKEEKRCILIPSIKTITATKGVMLSLSGSAISGSLTFIPRIPTRFI